MGDVNVDRRTLGLSLAGAAAALARGDAAAQEAFDTGAVVSAAAAEIRARFVDPAMANRMADQLLLRLQAGAYRSRSGNELAERLTADLQAMSDDLHLVVRYEPPGRRERAADWAEDDFHHRDIGWGVQTVARLPGNIGLLRVTHSPGGEMPTMTGRYAAAMTLLEDTNAMIVDLTANHGGGTDSQAYFLSYFLEGEIELRRMIWRDEPVEIIATTAALPAPRYAQDKPLLVAISNVTFSAGEAVALELKQHRNATLVGQRTRGGANGGNFVDLPQHFRIFIVFGRPDGPSWEGVGVPPDIETRPERAVGAAYRLALQGLLDGETDPARAQVLRSVATRSIENLSSFWFDDRGRARL